MSQEKDDNKITVTWDDLQNRKVEQRLKEQEALTRNRIYAAMDETMVAPADPKAAGAMMVLWRNSIFSLALFGLIGGLLAWGCGALLEFKADLVSNANERLSGITRLVELYEKDLRPGGSRTESDADFALTQAIRSGSEDNEYFKTAVVRTEAEARKRQLYAIERAKDSGVLEPVKATAAKARITESEKDNPYFGIMADQKMSADQKDQKLKELDQQRDQELTTIADHDRAKALISNVLAFGVRGVIIAVLLAIAIPLTENNVQAVIVNGSVGAALGLLGGVAAAIVTNRIQAAVAGESPDSAKQFLATVAIWGAMGLFLTLAPGVVMRNGKKLVIGLTGGLIGGLIGGVAYEPIKNMEFFRDSPRVPELVAMLAIGLLAGLATGLIEDVAKTGWVKVVQGLIAGKQFILYRNPTFIGAGPDCQIYLFKDPKVGKRHAAIHIVPGGYELEDLPLGVQTLVNGKAAPRTRLKNGDRIQIGSTQLVFMEKAQAGN